MVFKGKKDAETRAYVRFLMEDSFKSTAEICRRAQVSRATVYRWRKDRSEKDLGKRKPLGRPRSIDARAERRMVRKLKQLRYKDGGFSTKTLLNEVGIDPTSVSKSTVTRTLRRMGYFYLPSRKKGILTEKDKTLRRKFAREMQAKFDSDVWTKDVCFYLDGVSFVHKFNPWDQARAPKGRAWRQRSEGLETGCTSKGSHVGTGGRLVKLFVAISYGEGVICCEQYEHLNGEYFRDFIMKHFEKIFKKSHKPHSCLFIQDGDPSQNSSKARKAMNVIGAKLLSIPPRSPDLNPIENLFHLVKKRVEREALEKEITYESFNDFSKRVKLTFDSISKVIIDNIIGSMGKRIGIIIKNNGSRTKY